MSESYPEPQGPSVTGLFVYNDEGKEESFDLLSGV